MWETIEPGISWLVHLRKWEEQISKLIIPYLLAVASKPHQWKLTYLITDVGESHYVLWVGITRCHIVSPWAWELYLQLLG